ncbi:uncharacterized protein PFL1_06207 [Pseudozyma flocculosa PF-1]|uniref:Uncharacterized protein n=2 Tax=Pseudozyma flocculosa TaxID=84751 RepID=A0A5C3F775_9BASI|nr:uncharacterized protein PFL1_06207 [Pseudozyma flocculosa PF-1]EPQ26272.1 hypothetical protein PFL1_06207 [Pseudozyma flocculosa PF-1]SPO40232.1 uncharacterized protein PSFLO_05714 [Pseudozyma flocculosa]
MSSTSTSKTMSLMMGKPADPKEICGMKHIVFGKDGMMTAMGANQPLRMMGPSGSMADAQVFDIKHNPDHDTYCLMSKQHKGHGVVYPHTIYPGVLLTMGDKPCHFKICHAHEGSGYIMKPVQGEEHCEGCNVSMAMNIVYPPMIAIQSSNLGVARWAIVNA